MSNQDWQASWIWGAGEESPRNEWRCFRKSFYIGEKDIESGSLRITADSRYVLFVNGKQLGRGPVRSWPAELSYDTYDIKHLLKAGQENTIAVLVLHFGVSTFYYVRGKGGLLLELQYNNQLIGTDNSWKTSVHLGQQPRAPRMSCQQAFSEYIDARHWTAEWAEPSFSVDGWSDAIVLGAAGIEPWSSLVPRDIPMLTEEVVYPARIESLAKLKTFSLSTAVDVRNSLVIGSEDHANVLQFVGYVAAGLSVSKSSKITLGFLACGECLKSLSINGEIFGEESFYGNAPEKYLDVELQAGEHFILIDVSGTVHTGKLQIGAYSDNGAELAFVNLFGEQAEAAESAFYTVGPFDEVMLIDHQYNRPLNVNHPIYMELMTKVTSARELAEYGSWLRPINPKYVSEADVFSLCVWRKENEFYVVPEQLQQAIIPNLEAGVIPLFEGYDSEIVIDFGKEYSGYLRFDIEAEAGTILDWYGYEYMRDDYRQDMFGLDHTIRYVASEGRQSYETPIRRGFRYLALNVREAKSPVKIYGVEMVQSNYPIAEVGRFECSDGRLNDIWEIAKHTTKLCMEDTFVDCPAFEQVFWVGDSRNEGLVSNYLFGAQDIIKRCLRLVPGSKDQTPLYMDQVPSGWSSVIPNWTFFWAIACYEYYEQSGDKSFAKEMYEHIRFTLRHYLLKIDASGLFNVKGWNLLDWSPIDQPNDGIVTHQNMFLARTLEMASSMGTLVGETVDSELFQEAAAKLRQAINEKLWSEEQQAYIDCIHADGRRSNVISVQTQVVAILTDTAPLERREVLNRYLIDPPAPFVQIGSPFMSFFYYEALSKISRVDLIVDDIRLNYGNMIDHGATTCWEQYPNFTENRANPDMLSRSHCHAWSSAPAYFLSRELLGIKSLSPGWTSVEVRPVPCGLKWARGGVPHPGGGRIDVSWQVEEEQKKIQIRVVHPEHAQVTVVVPEGYTANIEQKSLKSI
ncbi:family 78 glycoside hydrolase catalytic domain [Paenibacillus sp. IITD108]|uniref:family 78 glycoside hydrolase catalytic domain n=1 Tax=Paenibacillus sp. IITD108 TaxID=3116649 RepID=UPI002F3F19E8